MKKIINKAAKKAEKSRVGMGNRVSNLKRR